MFKKSLIIIAVCGLSLQSFAAKTSATKVKGQSSKTICQIKGAGDVGLIKFRGSTYEEAFQAVTDQCFQKRDQAYRATLKGQEPDQDRQILFAESCLNLVECV